MIIQTEALGFIPVRNNTIDNLIYNCGEEFSYSLLNLYHKKFMTLSKQEQEQFLDVQKALEKGGWGEIPILANDILPSDICSLRNYQYFNDKCGDVRRISYNSKDLKFEELNTKLWDIFTTIRNRVVKERQNKLMCISDDSYYDIYPESNYRYFFGGGEFPFLLYRITRIGNVDYGFGVLTR